MKIHGETYTNLKTGAVPKFSSLEGTKNPMWVSSLLSKKLVLNRCEMGHFNHPGNAPNQPESLLSGVCSTVSHVSSSKQQQPWSNCACAVWSELSLSAYALKRRVWFPKLMIVRLPESLPDCVGCSSWETIICLQYKLSFKRTYAISIPLC